MRSHGNEKEEPKVPMYIWMRGFLSPSFNHINNNHKSRVSGRVCVLFNGVIETSRKLVLKESIRLREGGGFLGPQPDLEKAYLSKGQGYRRRWTGLHHCVLLLPQVLMPECCENAVKPGRYSGTSMESAACFYPATLYLPHLSRMSDSNRPNTRLSSESHRD